MGKLTTTLLALSLVLTSCENLYDWDPGVQHTPQLTVFAHLRPGEDPMAMVGRTFAAQEPVSTPWLSNAVVCLYANGELVDTLHPIKLWIFDLPYYFNNFSEADSVLLYRLPGYTVQEGGNYSLRVGHPGFESVYANVHIPQAVQPDTAWVLPTNEGGSEVFVQISDAPGMSYYALEIQQEGFPQYFRSKSPGLPTAANSILQSSSNVYEGQFAPFSDALFKDGNIVMRLETYQPVSTFPTKVVLYTLDEWYFKYEYETQKSLLNVSLEGNPFGNPKPTITNLTNGFGIVAGTAMDSIPISP